MNRVNEYFDVARERYMMKLRREDTTGRYNGPPWSDNPVLANHRFCNVFREDDRATVWLRDNIRDPMRDQKGVLFAICAFRFFNRIETAEVIVKHDLHRVWSPKVAEIVLGDLKPIVGGAYVVHTPNNKGLNKLQGVIYMLNHVWKDAQRAEQLICGGRSMELAVHYLQEYPSVGAFVAYQIAADLRFTWVLDGADDIMTWAQIGPGSSKGLGWVYYNDPARFRYTSKSSIKDALPLMRELLAASNDTRHWPEAWPRWDMQTVQNWLCEFSKYQAGKRGERLKRNYP